MKTNWKSLSLLGSRLLFAVLLLCICCNDEEIPLTVACFTLSPKTAHVGDTIVFKDCSIAERLRVYWEPVNQPSKDSMGIPYILASYSYSYKEENGQRILDTSQRYSQAFQHSTPGIYVLRLVAQNPYPIISCSGVAGTNIEEDTKIDTLTILEK